MKKRGAFLTDVIKADLKHTSVAKEPENIEAPQPSAADKTITHPDSDPGLDPGPDPDQGGRVDRSAAETLYELVAEVTGFPKETLTLDSRLLDDLNLDSIKSGDLIARYAEHFGLSGELDPAEWTNASLGEIVDLIAHRPSDAVLPDRENQPLKKSEVLEVLVDQASRMIGIPIADVPVDALVGPDLQLRADQLHQLLVNTSKVFKLELNLDMQPLLNRSPDPDC